MDRLATAIALAACGLPLAQAAHAQVAERAWNVAGSNGSCEVREGPSAAKNLGQAATRATACSIAATLSEDQGKCRTFSERSVALCAQEQVTLPSFFMKPFKAGGAGSTLKPFIVGGAPADPKAFSASLNFDGACSATIVGARAILTAAHCVEPGGQGTVDIGDGKPLRATCTHHPDYKASLCKDSPERSECTADVALCSTPTAMNRPGLKYESVQTDRSALGAQMQVLLLGYGCTTTGGTDFGALYLGTAKVKELSATTPSTFDSYFMRIDSTVRVCAGDSGGGSLDNASDPRRVIGVNKGVKGSTSYLVQTTDKRILDFMKSWSAGANAMICGVAHQATGCR
jgi:Trypsin